LGKIAVSKTHVLCQHTQHYGISSRLQEILCLLGQAYVFEESEEILQQLLGIAISAKQIQRVSEQYGQALEDQQQQYQQDEKEPPVLKLKAPQEPVYVMMDGSMVFTREEGWKEMKVGRLFNQSTCTPIQQHRNAIVQSLYVCHLGEHKAFLNKWESYTQAYPNKVCIADGAKWIWNWVEDCYPQCVQILDFFHAAEKLGSYAALQYPDSTERNKWMELQKQRLRNNEAHRIIAELQRSTGCHKEAQKARTDVIRYYENNLGRMQYKTYLDKGYLIGSGAIEAAHRNVIQQRLKLSGQRWSVKGAQQIANLRASKKSNQWNAVINLINAAA
jgi:hypothetical protein